jgi:hypothetical protein
MQTFMDSVALARRKSLPRNLVRTHCQSDEVLSYTHNYQLLAQVQQPHFFNFLFSTQLLR